MQRQHRSEVEVRLCLPAGVGIHVGKRNNQSVVADVPIKRAVLVMPPCWVCSVTLLEATAMTDDLTRFGGTEICFAGKELCAEQRGEAGRSLKVREGAKY